MLKSKKKKKKNCCIATMAERTKLSKPTSMLASSPSTITTAVAPLHHPLTTGSSHTPTLPPSSNVACCLHLQIWLHATFLDQTLFLACRPLQALSHTDCAINNVAMTPTSIVGHHLRPTLMLLRRLHHLNGTTCNTPLWL